MYTIKIHNICVFLSTGSSWIICSHWQEQWRKAKHEGVCQAWPWILPQWGWKSTQQTVLGTTDWLNTAYSKILQWKTSHIFVIILYITQSMSHDETDMLEISHTWPMYECFKAKAACIELTWNPGYEYIFVPISLLFTRCCHHYSRNSSLSFTGDATLLVKWAYNFHSC